MKLGKEIKLDLLDNYKTKIGTVNNKESKSLFNYTIKIVISQIL